MNENQKKFYHGGLDVLDGPDSCDTPQAGLGKHTTCKSSSTKIIYSHHHHHPARSRINDIL